MKLENEESLPWTASTGLGWVILIVALTSGAALIALGIYLSLWVRSKGRSSLPLYGFLFVLFFSGADLGLSHALAPNIGHALGESAAIAWFLATYSLRYEIRQHYKNTAGWEPQIGLLFTFLFSSMYINYCLNRFDLSLRDPQPVISLHLSDPPDASNLRK